MAKRLEPWHENLSKRQVKAPKIYLADSGILHTLLGLETRDDLLGHPKVGASWEGFAIGEVVAHLGRPARGVLLLEAPQRRRARPPDPPRQRAPGLRDQADQQPPGHPVHALGPGGSGSSGAGGPARGRRSPTRSRPASAPWPWRGCGRTCRLWGEIRISGRKIACAAYAAVAPSPQPSRRGKKSCAASATVAYADQRLVRRRNGCDAEKSVATAEQRLIQWICGIFIRRNGFFGEKTAAPVAQRNFQRKIA